MANGRPTVTLQGTPLDLAGPLPSIGSPVPSDCVLLDSDLQEVRLGDLAAGRVVVIASVPSLDTPVCDVEARRFNQEALSLGGDVRIVVVSMDLPFAQARWCGAADARRITVLSDHRDAAFGRAFGVLIPALRLLARAVFVADRDGVLRHVHLVPEIAREPEYGPVLDAVREAL